MKAAFFVAFFYYPKLELLKLTKNGIYCPHGDFYIDASGRVERNVVTHAHSDHAKPGHSRYLTHKSSESLLRVRLGNKISVQTLDYLEEIKINDVTVSLHPAGHIYGSSQIKVSHKGENWVVSGDYKLEDDQLSKPFEPVKCDTFITECTFGLPVYSWPDQNFVYQQINEWWRQNKSEGVTSLLFGYSLGKSQRIIKNIDPSIGPIFVHKTIGLMNDAIIRDGGKLPKTNIIDEKSDIQSIKGNLIIAPPSITSRRLMQGLAPISRAMASGWAQTGKNFGRSAVDKGFILSDHVDWDGLMKAIDLSEADRIITMHGYTAEVSRWSNENGKDSCELNQLSNQPYKL